MRYRTVLIVEDDQAIRDTLRLTFDLEGYHVIVAENGQEAIDLLRPPPPPPRPCLILLDLMMPIMNGWEFADLLEKDEGLAAIPIVVISAFGDQEYQERPERQERKMNNVRKILRKPIDLNSILAIVAEFCGPGTHVYPERDPC